jgi:Polyketide cyclase / dehydrase and lipid transport
VLHPLSVLDRRRSSRVIEYGRRVDLFASPQVVWSVLEDLEYWAGSSPWLACLTVDDPGLRAGATVRATITTPLPFQVRFRLDLEEWVPTRLVVAGVHGDLEGQARLALNPEGNHTCVDLSWRVEMTSPPMRAMARVAHPLLRWGHDMVVQAAIGALTARVSALQGPLDLGPALR